MARAANLATQKVFTTGQIAKILAVAPRTVSKWIDGGTLKGFRLPGSSARRVVREELRRFLVRSGYPTDWLAAVQSVLFVGCEPVLVSTFVGGLSDRDDWRVESVGSIFAAGVVAGSLLPNVVIVDPRAFGRIDACGMAARLRDLPPAGKTLLIAIADQDFAGPYLAGGYGFVVAPNQDVSRTAADLLALVQGQPPAEAAS